MGIFTVLVRVSAPTGERAADVAAMVDTGSTYAVFPESLLYGLGLSPLHSAMFQLADNQTVEYKVGEARLEIDGRYHTVPVIFAPDTADPLIGATTLEIFLLGVDPVAQRLVPVNGMLK